MNNKLKILPICVFSLLNLGAGSLPEGLTLTINPIGPYVEGNSDVSISVKISAYRSYSNAQVRVYFGIRGEDFSYVYTTPTKSVTNRRTAAASITLPLNSMLTNKGMDGRFEALINGVVDKSYPFSLNPVTYPVIPVQDYIDTPYVVDDVVVNPLKYQEQHQESYSFNGFIDYFNEDNYYRLHIDNLYINYSCFRAFPGCTAYLHFIDYNHIFPYLDSGDSIPVVDIPLRVFYEDNAVIFEYPSIMYVDPKTLEMSLTPVSGMVETHQFYLPRNKLSLLVDQDFYLNVTNFGFGQSSFSWKMKYVNNRNLIGDCDSSDYCVVGEVI